MVHYSAPRQECTSMPMEWTAIPNDDECYDDVMHFDSPPQDQHVSSSQSQCHGHYNARSSLVPYESQRHIGGEWRSNGDDSSLDSRGDADNDPSRNIHHFANNSFPSPTPSSQQWDPCLQSIYEGYLSNMDRQYFMQQMYERRRRRRRFVVFVTIVGIIALVLYKYAPPPPPVEIILPTPLEKESEGASSSTEFEALFSKELDSSLQSKMDITQQRYYDSWGKYCQHTLQLFTDAFLHQLSVFWYALSNAFLYAAYEARLVFVDFVRQKMQNRSTTSSARKTKEDSAKEHKHHVFTKTECPIRLPAASNRRISQPRGANHAFSSNTEILMHGFSTEEFLRQSIGASLSPQNLALTLLAEGIDSWGKSSVEAAPLSLVHRMSAAMETGYWIHDGNHEDYRPQWILPPALGVLLIGPEGVGKLHTARLLGRWFFDHCDGADEVRDGDEDIVDPVCALSSMEERHLYCSSDFVHNIPRNTKRDIQSIQTEPNGILEIMAEEYSIHQGSEATSTNSDHPIKEMIVKHILRRQHIGSVIITHHMELLPLSLLSEISSVITGKSHDLSYTSPTGDEVSACTNGTVFAFTSKQWGTKSIFEEIQKSGMRVSGLRRESLLSSVRWEVNSHLESWGRMANQLTVAPFLPFQHEDLKSILLNEVHLLNKKYQDLHWKRLHLSNTAMDYFLSTDHVENFDLFAKDSDPSSTALTFSLRGATSFKENALVKVLHTKLTSGTSKRPYKVAFVDVTVTHDERRETVLKWCSEDELHTLMECEEEWRLVLN